MTLRDEFDKADVLATLSWIDMTPKVKIAKLANHYLDNERHIDSACRNYHEATYGTVSVFVRSLLAPPKGEAKLTYNQVLEEIPRQKVIRCARKQGYFVYYDRYGKPIQKELEARKEIPREGISLSIKKRQNIASEYRYSIWEKDYRGDKRKRSNNCVGIAKFAGMTLIVDGGDYSSQPRIWMRDERSHCVKLVVLSGPRVTSVNNALLRLTPRSALRGALSGTPIRFDFNAEACEVEGKLIKWKKVIKTYYGAEVHQSER